MTLDQELDTIYDTVDRLMTSGKFEELNDTLRNLDVSKVGLDLALGYLTSTLPAKTKLPARVALLEKTEVYARENRLYEPSLFQGL